MPIKSERLNALSSVRYYAAMENNYVSDIPIIYIYIYDAYIYTHAYMHIHT